MNPPIPPQSIKQIQQLRSYQKHSKLYRTPLGISLLKRFEMLKLNKIKTPHNIQ
jgi:hypothetical protein